MTPVNDIAEIMKLPDGDEATTALAVAIADICAPETILTSAMPVTVDGEPWYDIAFDPGPGGDPLNNIPTQFASELRYCEARGLLRHHPTQPNLVQEIED